MSGLPTPALPRSPPVRPVLSSVLSESRFFEYSPSDESEASTPRASLTADAVPPQLPKADSPPPDYHDLEEGARGDAVVFEEGVSHLHAVMSPGESRTKEGPPREGSYKPNAVAPSPFAVLVELVRDFSLQTPLPKCVSCCEHMKGVVSITNTTSRTLYLTKLRVLLSGTTEIYRRKVRDGKMVDKPSITHLFLHMDDLGAGWVYNGNWTRPPEGYRVPYCTELAAGDRIPSNYHFQPGVTYHKLFVFVVPHRTLDVVCPHDKGLHCQSPPLLGLNRDRFRELLTQHRNPHGNAYDALEQNILRDLSIANCSVLYLIEVTLEGPVMEANDSPVVLNFTRTFLEFTPCNGTLNTPNEAAAETELRNVLLRAHDAATGERTTHKYTYRVTEPPEYLNLIVEALVPITKKALGAAPKLHGTATVMTRKRLLRLDATRAAKASARPPPRRTLSNSSEPLGDQLWELDLQLDYLPKGSHKPPEIRSIVCELEVMTALLETAIPMELTPLKLHTWSSLLLQISQYWGGLKDLDTVELLVLRDMRSLRLLYVKSNTIQPFAVKHSKVLWKATGTLYSADVGLAVHWKGCEFRLVPLFQTCLLARMYCLVVCVRFAAGETARVVLPVQMVPF